MQKTKANLRLIAKYNLEDYRKYLQFKGYSHTNPAEIYHFLRYAEEIITNIYNPEETLFENYVLYCRRKNYGNVYINKQISYIKIFYNYLIDRQKVSPETFKKAITKVPWYKIPQKKAVFLLEEEVADMLEMGKTFIEYFFPLKMDALIWFMFYTGVRRGELMRLKRQDIDLINKQVLIKVPNKTAKERYVYFPDKVKELLLHYFKAEAETTNAFSITKKQLSRIFLHLKQFTPRNKPATPHTLRHSFANLLARNKVDIKVAQKLLGHASIFSTMRYYNPDDYITAEIYHDIFKNVK